jgi:hypothetical protein
MRQGFLVVLAAFAALLTAPSALAAFEVRISVIPSIVEPGRLVKVELRSFSIVKGVRSLADDPGRGLHVEALSPAGRVVRIGLRHTSRGVWRGSFRFQTLGRWRVRVANWPASGGRGPVLTVEVRETTTAPATTP